MLATLLCATIIVIIIVCTKSSDNNDPDEPSTPVDQNPMFAVYQKEIEWDHFLANASGEQFKSVYQDSPFG